MLKNLLGYFSNDLSIDLGTANTLIYLAVTASFSTNRRSSLFARNRAAAARVVAAVGAPKPRTCWAARPGNITLSGR